MKIIAIGDFHCQFPEKLKKIILKEKPDLILSTGDYAGNREWRPLLRKVFKARSCGKNLEIEDLLGKKKYEELLARDYSQGKQPLNELNKFNIPVLSVFGNGDWYDSFFNDSERDYRKIIRKMRNIENINRGRTNFGKLKFVGFGGYLDPDIYFTKKGKEAIGTTEERTKIRKKRYASEEKDLMEIMKYKPEIILSHYTPYNCLDKLTGEKCALYKQNMGVSSFNRAIKRFNPVLMVCGHMHENQGKSKIGKTIIVNPGSAAEGKLAVINFDEIKKKVVGVRFIK